MNNFVNTFTSQIFSKFNHAHEIDTTVIHPFINAPLFTFLMRYLFLIFLDTVKFHIVSATIYIYIQIQYITIHLKPCKFRKNSELKLKGFPILYNRPVSCQIYRKALMTITSIQKRKTESSYEYSK